MGEGGTPSRLPFSYPHGPIRQLGVADYRPDSASHQAHRMGSRDDHHLARPLRGADRVDRVAAWVVAPEDHLLDRPALPDA